MSLDVLFGGMDEFGCVQQALFGERCAVILTFVGGGMGWGVFLLLVRSICHAERSGWLPRRNLQSAAGTRANADRLRVGVPLSFGAGRQLIVV